MQGLTYKEAIKKKTSYFSHLRGISGAVDIEDGVISVHKDLRIQSNKAYFEQLPNEGMKLVAHGNVMVNYRGKTIICDYLEYYENTDTCLLTNGKFTLYPWFLGGSMMTLSPERLIIYKGYISTSEGPYKHVCLSGDYLEYSEDNVLTIGKTQLTICKLPLLTLPQISIMPMEIPKPPINFRGGSGGFLGSYLGISYAPISRKHLATTFFLDSFFKHGIGMGYNMRFLSKKNPNNFFHIKSYYAHHLAIDMEEAKDRYRLHGKFSFSHQKAKLCGECHISDSWETVADIFPNNFSLKNTKPTNVYLTWKESFGEAMLSTSIKVNTFQNINQELPYLYLKQYPVNLGHGIFLETLMECGYLDFNYSKNVSHRDFRSLRAAFSPKVYRAIPLPYGILTPMLSGTTIYYNQLPSPYNRHGQASGTLSLDYRIPAQKRYFNNVRHIVEPFITIFSTTRPLLTNDEHYIFSIRDAFHALHLLRIGCTSSLFWSPYTVSATLQTTHLINNANTKPLFPKTSCTLSIPITKNNTFIIDTEWIWKKAIWDHMNILWEWVGSRNIALSLEFLHRSKYSLLKCDKENFVLDVSHPLLDLLNSSLSDRRNLLIGKLFIRPNPCWSYTLNLRYGWHRSNSPNYLEYQMKIGTRLLEHWQLFSIYEKREADQRVFFYLKLDKPKKNALTRVS